MTALNHIGQTVLLQAYTEFIEDRGLPFRRVGGRGALLKKEAV